jgi:hypothetical protein
MTNLVNATFETRVQNFKLLLGDVLSAFDNVPGPMPRTEVGRHSLRPEKQRHLVYLELLRPRRRRNLTPMRERNILVAHHSELWNGKNLRKLLMTENLTGPAYSIERWLRQILRLRDFLLCRSAT